MRKIKINTWKAKAPIKEDGKVVGSKEVDENLLIAFNNLIAVRPPDKMPKGLDKFRIFSKLSKAFEKADKTGILKLEETEYMFLKKMLETDIPAAWGLNPNISKAITDFLEAKEE